VNDFELNKAIAEKLYPTSSWVLYEHAPDGSSVENGNGCILNFVESWDCLMPLVVEHCINFCRIKGLGITFEAWQFEDRLSTLNANPQRALAECLLKVLEAK